VWGRALSLPAPLPVQVEAALAHRVERRLLPALLTPCAELRFDAAHVAPTLQHQRLLETHGCSRLLQHLPLGTRIPTRAAASAGPAAAAAAAGGAKNALAPVSADVTCARLAAAEGAQVVLSSGAFRCLTNTLAGQAWELPVTVRRLARAGAGAGAELQVVFVDNPVLASGLSLRAKNQLFYKVRVHRCVLAFAVRRAAELLVRHTNACSSLCCAACGAGPEYQERCVVPRAGARALLLHRTCAIVGH
jgi:hypothetical protein